MKQAKPVLLVNFKTYVEATGKTAVKLAMAAQAVAKKSGANVVISVQPTDLQRVSSAVGIPVYAQHMDPVTPGSHTGWILPEAIKEAGAKGTLINHSEHNIDMAKIGECVKRCKELGFVSVCCAATPEKAAEIAAFLPDYIAIEPPELIGGKVSVSTAKPEVIENTVDAVKRVNEKVMVLCGAGVHCGKDVEKALELGAVGVLVASAIVKSEDPEKVMLDLISGF
jgi:triosephosphate isomerase (TIM)